MTEVKELTVAEEAGYVMPDPRPGHMSWASADFQLWYRQELRLYSDGRFEIMGDPTVRPYPSSLANVRTTDPEGKEIIANAPRKKDGKCGSCGKSSEPNTIRWIGIRWYGIPMPVRYLRRWFTKDAPAMDSYDGCGCIIKLKTVQLVLWSFCKLAVVGSKRVWAA